MRFILPEDVDIDKVKGRLEYLSFSLATTPLEIFKGDTLVGEATGFFYRRDDKLFLVTAKHCIFDERYCPDRVVIRLHTDIYDLRKTARKEINLYKNGEKIWIEHEDMGVDLALIEIDTRALENCYFAYFTKEDVFSESNPKTKDLVYRFEVGSPLLVIGYPLGLYDKFNNLPVHRVAFLASKYAISFGGKPCFLLDSYLPEGMSGSPVLTATVVFRGSIAVGIPYYLAGVLQGPVQIPYLLTQKGRIFVNDIGLYYAFYADLLESGTVKSNNKNK
ncbi:MAG: hypothetical protein DSY33_04140 [Archaeoglobus sp.]|nr:MAG: hypothetical protein DSY33_04140 [Archaeoglobus sp.]